MLRIYIFIAVFLSGASLMSIEMAGLRLVQPEFGSDIVVYGSLISVILGGMALGSYFGGKLSDRKPNVVFLGAILSLAGIAVLLMPFYSDGVFRLISPIDENAALASLMITADSAEEIAVYTPPDMRLATLSVGFLLFFIPSFLMGMVSPYSARLLIRKVGRIGSGIGKISSLSTLGSIIGTLGSTFFLIQFLGTRLLILSNGILLVVLGLLAFSMRFLKAEDTESVPVERGAVE